MTWEVPLDPEELRRQADSNDPLDLPVIQYLSRRATLTVPEAGEVMGLHSKSAAYRAAASGEMPGVRRIGGRKVVSAPVLLAWLLGEEATSDAAEVVPLRRTG